MTFEDVIKSRLPQLERLEIESFASFVKSMLIYGPDERPKAVNVLEHSWLK